MLKKEIEKLVEDQIKDAKLELWQGWFKIFMQFGGAIIVVFGLILPIWTRIDLTGEVKEAIQEMETKFEKLVETQLREPKVDCFVGNQRLENQTLTFGKGNVNRYNLVIKNMGEKRAENIIVRVYINIEKTRRVSVYSSYPDWFDIEISDREGFDTVFQFNDEIDYLMPKFSTDLLNFNVSTPNNKESIDLTNAILVFYYNTPDPTVIPFFLVVDNQ